MLSVGYRVTVGSTALAPGGGPVAALETSAAFGVPANACRVAVPAGGDFSAKPGDAVKVELGYGDALETVFTGVVAGVAHGFREVRVEALGAFAALAGARMNLLYEKETAGGIVGDVLGRAGVGKGTLEAGLKFATYALDDGRSAWAHLRALAARCGFDLWADPEDKAQFRAYKPAKTHEMAYGKDVLALEHDTRAAPLDGVEVFGASPVGQGQGEDASSWMTRKDVRGTAGESAGRVLRVVDPAARTKELAGQVAKGLLAGMSRTAEGRLRALGAPAVRLGDALRLSAMPASAHDGEVRVTGVRHRLHPQRGFVTEIAWERT